MLLVIVYIKMEMNSEEMGKIVQKTEDSVFSLI